MILDAGRRAEGEYRLLVSQRHGIGESLIGRRVRRARQLALDRCFDSFLRLAQAGIGCGKLLVGSEHDLRKLPQIGLAHIPAIEHPANKTVRTKLQAYVVIRAKPFRRARAAVIGARTSCHKGAVFIDF